MLQQTTEVPAIRSLWVVDDDEMVRELLCLVATEGGLETETFASGDAALARLADKGSPPSAILCDMQMPGTAGRELADKLRALCGSGTILIAMSGSIPVAGRGQGTIPGQNFDSFLLKPFTAQQLVAACEQGRMPTAEPEGVQAGNDVILDPGTYAKLSRGMEPARLAELYQLCISDARKRVAWMEQAAGAADDHAYRGAAHAIKGGCSMVGAVSVAAIASELEESGLPPSPDSTPLNRLLVALSQLERMLNDNVGGSKARPSLTGPDGHGQP